MTLDGSDQDTAAAPVGKVPLLGRGERFAAAAAAVVLIGVALVVVVWPPSRMVALPNCPNAAAGCVVSVDTDLTTLSTALAAVGFVAILVAILGIRFTTIKAAGVEGSAQPEPTAGLPRAASQTRNPPAEAAEGTAPAIGPDPVVVTIEQGLGTQLGVVPIAVTALTDPMKDVDPLFLRDYQSARRESQRSYFLTHVLGPPTQPGQRYSVALKVTPHRNATEPILSAAFYLGRSWRNEVFPCERGADGRFGIVTEAYGPFLALCEIEFADGARIVLDHYCDFDMGSLLPH